MNWLNCILPAVEETEADLLSEQLDRGLGHLEVQSTNDYSMPRRMAEYSLRILRAHKRMPDQAMLYVGRKPLRMRTELKGPNFTYRYRAVDIRAFDGDELASSKSLGDNTLAILASLKDPRKTVRRVLNRFATLKPAARAIVLKRVLTLAVLRGLETLVAEEARKMPVFNDILENRVLGPVWQEGREEGRQEGERNLLRRQMKARFGRIPAWANRRLAMLSSTEVGELAVRILSAGSLRELLR